MTLLEPPDSPYPIANLRTLLDDRAGIDLSPIELVEILWLALQQGITVPNSSSSQQQPEEAEQEQELPPPIETANTQVNSPTAAVVAESPQTGSQTAGTALSLNVPEAIALRNRRAISHSLRPLMRRVPSRVRQSLDEEATATQSAEIQTWNPIVRPDQERWLELAIVIEATNLLEVWRDTIAEFQHLMERHGAFRNVRTWQLKPDAAGEPRLFLQTSSGLNGNARSPKELLDAGRRRLVLVLSDCTSKAWRSGKIPRLMELWSRENPVTLVQLLPERYWDRTALKLGYPVALRSRLPGALSRDWAIDGLSPRRRRQLPGGLKLPVVTMQPGSLTRWAKAIAAIGEQQTTGIVLTSASSQPDGSGHSTENWANPAGKPLTAKALVQRFRATASAEAQALADRMAVLPVNWSVIRLIQKNWAQDAASSTQETGALHLAEIFLSELLTPLPMVAEPSQKMETIQQYDFVAGVRDVLLGTIPISEAQDVGEQIAEVVFKQLPLEVQQQVAADIEQRFGTSLSCFEAFLIPDLPWGEHAAAEILPFARVTGEVLRRWGGDYAALAVELEQISTEGRQLTAAMQDDVNLRSSDALSRDVQKPILGQSYSYRDFTTDAGYLYAHLEELREIASADELLSRFKMLFVDGDDYPEVKVLQTLHRMMKSSWIEQEFDSVFNRCCYILINYWWLKRSWELTPRLIRLIETVAEQPATSVQSTDLRNCLKRFTQSPKYQLLQDCEQVVNFIPHSSTAGVEVIGGLISQYPYLYPYYLREWSNNSDSGQQALYALKHTREQEFERSLYTYAKGFRREKIGVHQPIILPNQKPTSLSDENLQVAIRTFSGKSEGYYTYQDTARQTLVHLERVPDHRAAKHCIKDYLTKSIQHTSKPTYGDRKFNKWLGKQLDNSYLERDHSRITSRLLMNTCRNLIDALIVPPSRNFENHLMFTDLIANLGATFAMGFVLKIVLLCQRFGENLKAIREYVAARLADLFKYYESYSPDDLRWLIECLDNWLIASTVQFGRWDQSVWTSLMGDSA